jgi:hypothetical protein
MKGKVLRVVFVLFLLLAFSISGWSGDERYPIMKPDRATFRKWIESYDNAPRAFIDEKLMERIPFGGSVDLLSHIDYTPSERNQVSCGNCWIWAGTGVMEIAHSVQNGIKNRLSVQYVNSCKSGDYACCGGWLQDAVTFYTGTGKAIPWSNTNAHFKDGSVNSNNCPTAPPSVSCGSISTSPSYTISSISHTVIPTQSVAKATAIANIKNVLNQNEGVWFGFFLPNNSDWGTFFNFWNNDSESDVFDYDYSCDHTWIQSEGGGHAVLIVGYNDDDPQNSYWIALNSWGTEAGRPNGLFRIDMDMKYDCVTYYLGQPDESFYFQTLDIVFAGGSNTTTAGPNTTTTAGPSTTTTISGCVSTETDCYGDGTVCCPAGAPICCYGIYIDFCCYTNYPVCGTGVNEGYCYKCPARGTLTDDETKLAILREMRDERMASTALGSSLIDIYYENADEISDILLANEDLKLMTANVVNEIVEKAALLNSDGKVSIDQGLVEGILEVADAINAEASPGLKRDIKKVKREIRKGTIFRQLGIKKGLTLNNSS